MIELVVPTIDKSVQKQLSQWQREVDSATTYAKQVAAAKKQFSQRNKKRNPTFDAVKVALTAMCLGGRRCVYCEDSVADEVEHMRPKDLYPEQVFRWSNYVYACGNCNGPKRNNYAVISRGKLVNVARKPKAKVVAPAKGTHALIDPRVEDPMALLELDLVSTFAFGPRLGLDKTQRLRAEYTIELLALNARDFLLRERRDAYDDFCNALVAYRDAKKNGAPAKQLSQRRERIVAHRHPTVFREMQRQHARIDPLKKLFASVPGAAKWAL
jgi:uncharacterized protein (TIGR02646 family)